MEFPGAGRWYLHDASDAHKVSVNGYTNIENYINYVFHEILPVLASGVHIHFHDVFYPFEYPQEWLLNGRAWNEQYMLWAFLQYNKEFKIVMFNTYLESMYETKIKNRFPLLYKNTGGSIWLKKI